MEASTSAELTKEKQQAILISSYKQALALLQGAHTQRQGRQILLSIVNNPDTNDNALRELRLSSLLSLAELSKVQGQTMNALYYWHEATKIQPAFNTWIKMAQLLESLRTSFILCPEGNKNINVGLAQIQNQIQYAYKNAIKESPQLWRTKLLEKLYSIYMAHGKSLLAEDLRQVIKYRPFDESTLSKVDKPLSQLDKKGEAYKALNQQSGQTLPELWIPLNRILPSETQSPQIISSWDYLLTICLFFINNSSSLKKNPKKHEEILAKLSKFNQFKTRISFKEKKNQKIGLEVRQQMGELSEYNQRSESIKKSKEKEQSEQRQEAQQSWQQYEHEYDQKLSMLVIDYFKEVTKEKQSSSSKLKKPQNLSLNYSNKSTFESLQDYFKEVSVSKSINFNLLHSFKYIDPAYNPRIQLLSNRCDSVFDGTFGHVLQEPRHSGKGDGQIQEEACIGTRQRRSTSQGTPQQATPGRRQLHDQLKIQQQKQKQSKLKYQFAKFVGVIKEQRFVNILHLSQALILSMLQTYRKYGLAEQLNVDGSEEQRKSTSKLISLLMMRVMEISENKIMENPATSKVAHMLLIRCIEDEVNNGTPISRMAQLQSQLLEDCTSRIDSLIYKNSKQRLSNGQHSYTLEDLQSTLEQIYIAILLSTIPLPVNEAKIGKLIKYYYQLHSLYALELKSSEHLVLQPRVAEPARVEELVNIRMRRLKIKEFGQQECEQSTLIANIDKFLKNDMKNSEIIESVKAIVAMGTGSLLLYLKSFAKLVDILFNTLETNAGFNARFVQNSLKAMEIPMLIQVLHSKLTEGKKLEKDPKENPSKGSQQQGSMNKPIIDVSTIESQRSDYNIKIQTIFNLLKIYILNELDQAHSSLCLRIVFYLLEETFKTMAELQNTNTSELDIHYQYSDQICLIIIFLDSLVKMKESGELRRKFYHRILIKNIRFIYDLYNHATSGHSEIRVQVYKIYNETFHHKSFKPKKMEDCLGYFLMISRQFSAQFDKQQVEFEQKMKRVFNQCYLIFKQELQKTFQECERFTRAMQFFVYVMRKKRKQCQQFINFFTGKTQICECCQGPYLANNIGKQPFAKEVFFVVAKFLENRRNTEKVATINKDVAIQDQLLPVSNNEGKKPMNFIQLDDEVERSYLRYFLVAVNTGKAWYQMLRFQISKVYQSFDALVGPEIENSDDPITQSQLQSQSVSEIYKHKFKYAKTIASFIIKNFDSVDFLEAKQYALYRINLTNALKICERKFNKNLSEIEKVPWLTRQFGDKYMEGIVTVIKRKQQSEDQQFSIGNNFPEISFLFYTQFKLPFMIYNCLSTQQTEVNIKLLNLTIKEGFLLLRRIRGNGKQMLDENSEAQGLLQSKYNVSHLDKELKVQILGSLCQIILNSLRFIEDAADSMKKDPLGGNRKKITFTRQKKTQTTAQDEQKVILKLQLLLQLSRAIQSVDFEFQRWRQQCKDARQMESSQKNQACQEEAIKEKAKSISFKDKYLFPDYTAAINSIERALEKFVKILEGIAKQNINSRLRKQNYSRYIFSCRLWASKIYHQLGCREISLGYVKDISNLKNEDLVSFYHHYENQPTEQNLVLAEYYSRDIVFHCLKIEAIQHLLEVYSAKPQTLETCIMLIRKLGKMYSQRIQSDKDKSKAKTKQEGHKQGETANKDKKVEDISKKKPKDGKQKQEQQEMEEKHQKIKKEAKQFKEVKQKMEKMNRFEIKIKWVHILFLRGVELYFQAIVTSINCKSEPVEEKFEKALLEFKNKIKREVEKDRKKPLNEISDGSKVYGINLVNDIQAFIQFYESKFERKVRIKAPKKPKTENPQGVNENSKADQLAVNSNIQGKKVSGQQIKTLIKRQGQADVSEQEGKNSQSEDAQIENKNDIQVKKEDDEDEDEVGCGLGVRPPQQMIDEGEEDDSDNP